MSPRSQALGGIFGEEDLAAITEATRSAETRTAGEIVPYIVARVDSHGEARLTGALLGALSCALLAGLAHFLGGHWGGFGIGWITLPTLLGAALGGTVAGFGPIGRRLVPEEDLEDRVRRRAEAAFLEEEVFKTRHRTGILIFLALWEHRAVILADEGIHRVVPPHTWDDLVGELTRGLGDGRPRRALIEAITRCGQILAEHELERLHDDQDELADAPRIRER